MKILIGYDGSADADGALHDLKRAGLPSRASALVVTITTPWVPFGPEGQVPMGFNPHFAEHQKEALKDARALAERAAGFVRNHFPQWKVKSEAGIHEPAPGLLEIAEKFKPDLMVLGSHGRTALGRMLLGSVSQKILHHAQGSVRVTRPGPGPRKGPPRLLIGVDGSHDSDIAVAGIASRHWPKGTEVRVLAVLDSRKNPGSRLGEGSLKYEAELRNLRRGRMERLAAQASERLGAAGLDVTPSVVAGDPRAVLVKEAKAWGADCLFMGSRGLVAVERFLMGSVSSAVASHAPCTVEIVRKNRPARRKSRKP